jgi:hypothetical protein
MSEIFGKIRQKCRDAMHAGTNIKDDARRNGEDGIDFPVDILLPLEKDIHVNVVYANDVLV